MNNKARTTWDFINTITNNTKSNHAISLIYINGKLCSNNQIIANTFNNYFILLPDKVSINNQKQINKTPNVTDSISHIHVVFKQPFLNIKLTPLTTKEIKDIIKSLEWKNSQWYDEIPLKILKTSMSFIVSSLTYMCNKVLPSGIFPVHLKYSQIGPIFKLGDKSEISNYRPLSLLISFSKIFKRVIYNRSQFHIHSNNSLA